MNRETLEKMQQMRLQGMYYAFKTSLETLRMESMTIDQFVSWLVSSEWDSQAQQGGGTRHQVSQLPLQGERGGNRLLHREGYGQEPDTQACRAGVHKRA